MSTDLITSPILDSYGNNFPAIQNSSLRDPDDWFFDGLGAPPTAAGERVSSATAIKVETVFACCRNISDDGSKLPLIVYKRDKKDQRRKTVAYDEQLYSILHFRPNAEMSSMSWRRKMFIDALLDGNGYAEIVFQGPNVQEIWPLENSYVHAKRLNSGQLVYEIRNDREGKPDVLQPWQVFHLKGPTPDGIVGWRMTHLMRETIGNALAMEHSVGSELGNDSVPSGILTMPGKLGDDARKRLREQWGAVHGGARNRRRLAVLEEGLDYKPMAFTQSDQQFLERMQHTVEQICRWFRMPPHKVGHLLRATFSNIDAQNVEYLTDCLMTWLVAFEQECQLKLIPKNRTDLFVKHDTRAFLRGDVAATTKMLGDLFNVGMLSPNDGREFLDINPDENPAADMLYRNSATVPLDTPAPDPNASKGGDPQAEADDDAPTDGNKKPKQKDKPPSGTEDDNLGGEGPKPGGDPQARLSAIVNAHRPLVAEAFKRRLRIARDKVESAERKDDFAKLGDFFGKEATFVRNELSTTITALSTSIWHVCHHENMPKAVGMTVSCTVQTAADLHVTRSVSEMRDPAAVVTWTDTRATQEANSLCDAVRLAILPRAEGDGDDADVPLFVYGTFKDPSVLKDVIGRTPDYAADTLEGYRHDELDDGYSDLVEDSAASTPGYLVYLSEAELEKTDAWETRYERREVTLASGTEADAYFLKGTPGEGGPIGKESAE